MISEVFGLLFYIILGFLFGAFFVYVGVSNIRERKACTEERQAKFLRIETVPSYNNHTRTKAVFEVKIRGKVCEEHAEEALSRKQAKQFVEGEVYTIYVNPKNPHYFRCLKRVVYFLDIFCIFMGGFIVLSILLWGGKTMLEVISKYI